MNWYVAKIIFRILCGNGNHQPQFDEQLRLISANDESEAMEKAGNIIRAEQQTLLSADQEAIRWEFVNLTELYKLEDLKDGSEIYYNILEVDDADDYIALSNQKASMIRDNLTSGVAAG